MTGDSCWWRSPTNLSDAGRASKLVCIVHASGWLQLKCGAELVSIRRDKLFFYFSSCWTGDLATGNYGRLGVFLSLLFSGVLWSDLISGDTRCVARHSLWPFRAQRCWHSVRSLCLLPCADTNYSCLEGVSAGGGDDGGDVDGQGSPQWRGTVLVASTGLPVGRLQTRCMYVPPVAAGGGGTSAALLLRPPARCCHLGDCRQNSHRSSCGCSLTGFKAN